MKIQTRRFGEIEIEEEKIIRMIKPILGFESLKKYVLIEAEEMSPFMWLQSIEDPVIAFIVVNPRVFYPDYKIEVNKREVAEIGLTNVAAVETYVVATIPDDPTKLSLNLQGPIIVNTENRAAKQLVMVDSKYKISHLLFEELSSEEEPAKEKESLPVGV